MLLILGVLAFGYAMRTITERRDAVLQEISFCAAQL